MNRAFKLLGYQVDMLMLPRNLNKYCIISVGQFQTFPCGNNTVKVGSLSTKKGVNDMYVLIDSPRYLHV